MAISQTVAMHGAVTSAPAVLPPPGAAAAIHTACRLHVNKGTAISGMLVGRLAGSGATTGRRRQRGSVAAPPLSAGKAASKTQHAGQVQEGTREMRQGRGLR